MMQLILQPILSFLSPVKPKHLGVLDPVDVLIAESYQHRKQNDCLPSWHQRPAVKAARYHFNTAAWITDFRNMPRVQNRLPKPVWMR